MSSVIAGPAPRASIAALAPYTPPLSRHAALRLDFNENTLGCSPAALEALRRLTAHDLAFYPAVETAEARITAAYGHSPATGLLTNGTDEAIQLAVGVYAGPGDEVIGLEPSFALYRFYTAQAGALMRTVRLQWHLRAAGLREFEFSLDAVLAAISPRTRMIFVASPNNPTGHATPPEVLLELCRRVPQAMVFADEAYADFLDDPAASLLNTVGRVPNLLVARTFSKAHGLAGLRLGCLFGAPEAVTWLRRAHSPYNVNTVAAVCGAAAAQDPGWATAFASLARSSRATIEATLAELGIPYWRSRANFVLFDAGALAAPLLDAMRSAGVLLRDRCADAPGALRISCGSREQTDFACALLRRCWQDLA